MGKLVLPVHFSGSRTGKFRLVSRLRLPMAPTEMRARTAVHHAYVWICGSPGRTIGQATRPGENRRARSGVVAALPDVAQRIELSIGLRITFYSEITYDPHVRLRIIGGRRRIPGCPGV